MSDVPAVKTFDESEFDDAVRWLREQYLVDLAVLHRWPPLNRLLARYRSRHGFRRWRHPGD